MYLSFYNLLDKPFSTQPDPAFLWLGPKYAEAVSVLRHGIFEKKGFLLTGEAGTGKTTLVNALTGSFDKAVKWTVISDSGQERLDFYNAIARGFGIDREFSSKVQFLLQFSAFLHTAYDENKQVVLLVDDCHRLSQDMLEELRHLSNIEKADTRLVTLCFIGRREFLDTLSQPNNRAFGQRLSPKVDLVPLSHGETEEYIRHRLKIAGTEQELFTAKAIQIVYRAARGNPRLINMICDQALIAGATEGNGLVGRKSIEECLSQLNLPYVSRQDNDAPPGEKNRAYRLLHNLTHRFAPKKSAILSAARGWFRSDNPRRRWVKYGLGMVLVGGITISLFLQLENGQDTIEDAGRPAVQQPAAKEKVREALSPAVGKLEPIGKAIDLNMVADWQRTIVKKEDDEKKAMEGRTVSEKTEEEASPATVDLQAGPMPEPAVSGKPVEEKAAAAVRQTPEEPVSPPTVPDTGGAGEPGEKAAETPSKPAAEPKKTAAEIEPKRLPPMQPTKVVLPLRPNSLELTDEAEKDYGEFIEKLKNYPKAKLLVKGFVSAKTNSPENIKLSEERAMGVQKLLVKSGIAPARITVKGMGNQEPLAANDTSEGRTKNRRVEVEVVADGR